MPNRLISEDSPYLKQHAHNPVDWFAWGEEAFKKAKSENKPIFLSIGYSSCHWCHVMERESFENEDIAKILNDNFVSIKVDKEERPDIDKHFQSVYQLLNRRPGGWPTSIFLTADLKPFYAATYLPPKPSYGLAAFDEILRLISDKYRHDEALLTQKAEEILAFLNPKQKSIQATRLDLSIVERFEKQAAQLFDTTNGGFNTAPKFPQTTILSLLLDTYLQTKNEKSLQMVTQTLSAMVKGGFYDRVDGGFCRYSTDNEWLVPHFEKMTYDNALLSELYLKTYAITQNPYYKDIAFETIDFMLEKMSEDSLFYSASDADTDGEEGKYFTYGYQEVFDIFSAAGIPSEAVIKLIQALSVTKEGNFEGNNIIRLATPVATDVEYYTQAIAALRKARTQREYPFIDKEIQVSWNAMMIKSLYRAGRIEERYKIHATHSLETLMEAMIIDGELYHTALIGKTPNVKGFLEDYAHLCEALLEGYRSTLDESYLIKSIQFANQAIEKYYAQGRWKFSRGEFETDAEIYDNSYTSPIAVMLSALLDISALVDPVYKKFVIPTLELHSYTLMRQPISSPYLARAVIRLLRDDITIKSTETKLSEHIGDIDFLPYPFVHLKPDATESFLLCDSTCCFGNPDRWDDVVALISSR